VCGVSRGGAAGREGESFDSLYTGAALFVYRSPLPDARPSPPCPSDYTRGLSREAIRILFKYLGVLYEQGDTNLKAREKVRGGTAGCVGRRLPPTTAEAPSAWRQTPPSPASSAGIANPRPHPHPPSTPLLPGSLCRHNRGHGVRQRVRRSLLRPRPRPQRPLRPAPGHGTRG
jgi:hypothetical protein